MIAIAVVALVGWYVFSIWGDCLSTHSALYCMHVLNR